MTIYFLTFIEATSPQVVQIVKMRGELEKWSISCLMGFTFAIDPPNSPCVKESLHKPSRYVIYVNCIIKKAAAFEHATVKLMNNMRIKRK